MVITYKFTDNLQESSANVQCGRSHDLMVFNIIWGATNLIVRIGFWLPTRHFLNLNGIFRRGIMNKNMGSVLSLFLFFLSSRLNWAPHVWYCLFKHLFLFCTQDCSSYNAACCLSWITYGILLAHPAPPDPWFRHFQNFEMIPSTAQSQRSSLRVLFHYIMTFPPAPQTRRETRELLFSCLHVWTFGSGVKVWKVYFEMQFSCAALRTACQRIM